MKLDDIWTFWCGQGLLTICFCFPSLVTAPMAELLCTIHLAQIYHLHHD